MRDRGRDRANVSYCTREKFISRFHCDLEAAEIQNSISPVSGSLYEIPPRQQDNSSWTAREPIWLARREDRWACPSTGLLDCRSLLRLWLHFGRGSREATFTLDAFISAPARYCRRLKTCERPFLLASAFQVASCDPKREADGFIWTFYRWTC